ncbi:2-C-methyl-D-erythritol 2,4-cyclodiphosphate synthase [Blochmannia endosymbiont of Colobopsis nipponica]|uniref:2-C-methyl-D-erythritol 2,4-cyclodiphosphate synthase n=1 Tax=Blochmannia endosymbiont of Colobopsis nipponica TaxID=2681987 RepID=UPI00177BD163|nr:2-C-methyl-D-erythritol 2,4-cyclodiphosphate synthase [Blochmannia endosymbiont of Colobopsis nipponica]QOI11240.1 2-C-methyl-D-erythritol 2,4-cyclodiphosphate synthase [Blochmannia endosymbiont of Colobopsis nipponica]
MRVGHGFDVHRFGGCKPLIIGGVLIPFFRGLIAHSDGDVMLHAVMNSLLGATSLGDIGIMFPNTDVRFKDVDSRDLLRAVWQKVLNKGYQLGNLDITIIAQVPKVAPYISKMHTNLVSDLCCHSDLINIKSATTEKLGFVGRIEGIACESISFLV